MTMKEQLEVLLKKWEDRVGRSEQDKQKYASNPFITTQCNAEIDCLKDCISDLKTIIEQTQP